MQEPTSVAAPPSPVRPPVGRGHRRKAGLQARSTGRIPWPWQAPRLTGAALERAVLAWLTAHDTRLAAHALPIRDAAAQCSAAVGETVTPRDLRRVRDANPGRLVWQPGKLPGPEDGFLTADQWAALRSAVSAQRHYLYRGVPPVVAAGVLRQKVAFPVTPAVARIALAWLDAAPAGGHNGRAIDQ